SRPLRAWELLLSFREAEPRDRSRNCHNLHERETPARWEAWASRIFSRRRRRNRLAENNRRRPDLVFRKRFPCRIPFRGRNRSHRSGETLRYEKNRRPATRPSWELAEKSLSPRDADRFRLRRLEIPDMRSP